MHREYRMAKRAVIPVYILTAAVLVMLTPLLSLLGSVLHISATILLWSCWGVVIAVMTVEVPRFFMNAKAVMNESEIMSVRGFIVQRREYMPMDAVKSVTQVMTPLGSITGLNFIIVNALGSKLIILFMTSKDCTEAAEFINGIIAGRSTKMQDK